MDYIYILVKQRGQSLPEICYTSLDRNDVIKNYFESNQYELMIFGFPLGVFLLDDITYEHTRGEKMGKSSQYYIKNDDKLRIEYKQLSRNGKINDILNDSL